MEYPGFINISFRFPTHLDWITRRTRAPAGVTVHEFTHQYFYGIVANNEAEEPWLDEGLTTYSSVKAMEKIFGPGESISALSRIEKSVLFDFLNHGFGYRGPECDCLSANLIRSLNLTTFVGYGQSPFHGHGTPTLLGYELGDLDIPGFNTNLGLWRKEEYAPMADASIVTGSAGEFYPGSYHPIIYSKASLSLETLENHIGRDTMKTILRTYVDRHRFKHPRTDDFLDLVVEIAGAQYQSMVDQLFHEKSDLDFSVDELTCRAIAQPAGFATQKAPGELVLELAPQAIDEAAGGEGSDSDAAAEASVPGFEWEVVVRNRGGVVLPVEVELYFEGGRTVRQVYAGKEPFLRIRGESPDRLLAATVDPDRKFALDLNWINNSRSAERQQEGTLFLSGLVHFWTQNFLNGWAFFN
jgi:hypothetical protein